MINLAVLTDYPEEDWPSMRLCADMLLAHLPRHFLVKEARPPFRRILSHLPIVGRLPTAFNADRLFNRFVLYPRFAHRIAHSFDFFHLCDHSYSQLLHELPAGRAGVFCHDLDTFRCLLEPERDPRPRWFCRMARNILDGFRKAAIVFHPSMEVRRQIERFSLIDPGRLVYAPNGVASEFTSQPSTEDHERLPGLRERPFLLHVGSCIARKRIDVLLDVFAETRRRDPELRLIQVGGTWSPAQHEQIERLGLAKAIQQVRRVARPTLAALYRRASLVLVPSEAEGFGLPIVEALACGAPVIASDIPALHEVGGDAVIYRPVGDVAAWVDAIRLMLADTNAAPLRERRLAHAARWSWEAQAATIAAAYRRLASEPIKKP